MCLDFFNKLQLRVLKKVIIIGNSHWAIRAKISLRKMRQAYSLPVQVKEIFTKGRMVVRCCTVILFTVLPFTAQSCKKRVLRVLESPTFFRFSAKSVLFSPKYYKILSNFTKVYQSLQKLTNFTKIYKHFTKFYII